MMRSPEPAGFGWGLRFEAVRRTARVVLNGVVLGTHTDPYVPFTLPATSLRPGQPNELVVYVDNRKGPEPREGWWNWGGVTRPISLVPQGPVVFSDWAHDAACAELGPAMTAMRGRASSGASTAESSRSPATYIPLRAGFIAWGAVDDAQKNDSQGISKPPDSFFELVPELDRDVARRFYMKYLQVGGMPVVAAVVGI